MSFWAILGLAFTIIPVAFLTVLLIAGLVKFDRRRGYNPLDEILAWWVILLAWVPMVALAVWQPLHWAGLA